MQNPHCDTSGMQLIPIYPTNQADMKMNTLVVIMKVHLEIPQPSQGF